MLINYLIEPSAIPVGDGIERAVRRQILDAINDYGIRAGSNQAWREVLERIPYNERKFWEVALASLPHNEFDVDFRTSSAADAILDRAKSSIVTLSESSFAQWASECDHSLNPGEEIFTIKAPPLPNTAEVLTVTFFSDSTISDDRRHWNEAGVKPGDDRDQIWGNRILPILQHSTTVHIIDRYFLTQISRSANSRQRQRDSGAFWLAEKLRADLSETPIALNLYTLEVEGSLDSYNYELLKEFREAAGSGIRELNCFLPIKGAEMVIPHDRHWRGASSKWSAKIEFGSSVDMFENSQFTQNFQLRAFVLTPSARSDLMNSELNIQGKCQKPIRFH
jgi:hypothetical protein